MHACMGVSGQPIIGILWRSLVTIVPYYWLIEGRMSSMIDTLVGALEGWHRVRETAIEAVHVLEGCKAAIL